MVFWYMFSVWSGSSIEDASDIYEPQAMFWCLAAIAGIFTLGWWWQQRTRCYADDQPRVRACSYTAGLLVGSSLRTHFS